jgi:hypothetical protein
MNVGRTLVLLGLALVAAGLVWMFGSKLGLGRLPGDIVVEKKNFGFYFPIVSSIVVSLVLTLLLNLFRR